MTTALLGCLLFAGCMTPAVNDPSRVGPFFTPVNHAGEDRLAADFRRVVLLPICGGEVVSSEVAAVLAPAFTAALQQQNRFEVVTLSRDECRRRFGTDELSSTAALPRDLLSSLRREYAADGVIFVDLTVFRGYRPLTLGLRAKLATLSDSRLVWTFDNVFAADVPAVANSARHHFVSSDSRGVPGDLSPAVLQSPSRFAEYAAATMFATLPPVFSPAKPPPTTGKNVAR